MGKKRREQKEEPSKTGSSKRKRKLLLISLAVILGIVVLIAAINVNVKLLFDTEASITLSPTVAALATAKDPVNITFTTEIEKLSMCALDCTFTLIDESADRTIDSTTVQDCKERTSSFTLTPPASGEGQVVYTYHATCVAQDRKVCPSAGKSYAKMALVTLDYTLSTEELETQGRLRQRLLTQAVTMASVKTTVARFSAEMLTLEHASIGSIPEMETLLVQYQSLAYAMTAQGMLFDEATAEWSKGSYEDADELVTETESRSRALERGATSLEADVRDTMKSYEDAVERLQNVRANNVTLSRAANILEAADAPETAALLDAAQAYDHAAKRVTTRNLTSIAALATAAESIKLTTEQALAATAKAEQQGRRKAATLIDEAMTTLNATDEQKPSSATIVAACASVRALTVRLQSLNNDTNTTNGTSIDLKPYHSFIDRWCATPLPLFTREAIPADLTVTSTTAIAPTTLPTTTTTCCFHGTCKQCCDAPACTPPSPIVLVHGHAFSKSTSPELAFTRLAFLQERLAEDDHLSAGTLGATAELDSIPSGTWGRQGVPIVVSVTYYYLDTYGLGDVRVVTRKADSIENYAIRLREALNTVEQKTGSDQVILIAHSMGGLVSREELSLFGSDDVKALITLGTPNQGVEAEIRKYCTLTGAKKECSEMAKGSVFLNRLNSPANTPATDLYTVTARGCRMQSDNGTTDGDGVVLARNAKIAGVTNHDVNGTCTDLLKRDLHMAFVNPETYPETYDIVKGILEKYEQSTSR